MLALLGPVPLPLDGGLASLEGLRVYILMILPLVVLGLTSIAMSLVLLWRRNTASRGYARACLATSALEAAALCLFAWFIVARYHDVQFGVWIVVVAALVFALGVSAYRTRAA